MLRWKYPNIYQMWDVPFRPGPQERHRDVMQRVWYGPDEDRYLSPWDGHLAKLVVQCTQDIYERLPKNSTYRHTFVRNVSPIYLLAANWPFEGVSTEAAKWDEHEWTMVCLKWLPACTWLLCVLLWSPNAAEGQVRNGGWYDPFPYRFWGYPKAATNIRENHRNALAYNSKRLLERILRPRWLCFLNKGEKGITLKEVTDDVADVEYLMIAYTTKQFDNFNDVDMTELHLIAEKAARKAGVDAFWVAGSCMRDAAQMEEDVYRINDVVRGAHSLVIVVGPSDERPEMGSTEDMLRQWGERVWTLPEVLLSNDKHDINIYTRGQDDSPWPISKKKFADVVWNDPLISRQLVDHYNKTLELSRLELVSIALTCLLSRERGYHLPGDLSYALMGLLRQRPSIDKTDSLFQSFARLSIANDSDQLLERLVCMLPKEPMLAEDPWTKMDDQWDCNLWDINPSCQVAGICNDDTVLLDGAFGAAIRWKSFATVAYLKKDSWKRLGARTLIHGAPLYFVIGCVMVGVGATYEQFGISTLTAVGGFFLAASLCVILASPYLVRLCYSGKLWGTQAWFFGFEGYMDLATIESNIFGAYMGRLKWSPAGSTLSRHMSNSDNECVGLDPTTDDEVRAIIDRAVHSKVGEPKVYTIVDTYTLTVTMFTAVRPPVAVILCGREGGMQRAVMCSYDWKSQTLYRETVLRMETPILERMFRVNRFRFGFKRPPPNI
ncbi:hypothetical protein B0J14DRAFT_202658 [Halenospora varia]|nr:hypothetical protein B0J14DRAFT_202658 [Halenospora varia]